MSSAVTGIAASGKQSEQERRAAAEAKQSGAAAPDIDEATGKEINPHNPSFLTDAPWYLNQQGTSLKHLDNWKKKEGGAASVFKKGTKGDIKTKFIKGACENCGARTHKTRDCVERPRAKGAKWTGKNLASDEHIVEADEAWDAKRDRWKGFHEDDYKKVIQEYERVDMERKRRKAEELENKFKAETNKKRRRKLKKKLKKSMAKLGEQAKNLGYAFFLFVVFVFFCLFHPRVGTYYLPKMSTGFGASYNLSQHFHGCVKTVNSDAVHSFKIGKFSTWARKELVLKSMWHLLHNLLFQVSIRRIQNPPGLC